MKNHPPKWIDRFLIWYCKPELLEEIQGDAHELYFERLDNEGKIKADLKYGFDIIRFCRWTNIKNLNSRYQSNQISVSMFKNYFKIAWRNIWRHKGISFINIAGLAVGMACCIVVLVFVRNETQYDTYHELGDRIYRVTSNQIHMATGENYMRANSPRPWGPVMKQDYPEIVDYVRFTSPFPWLGGPWDVKYGESTFTERRIFYADSSVFSIFSWPLNQGHPETALTQPNSIVLSESMAKKYFGGENPLGKILVVNPKEHGRDGRLIQSTTDFLVTGVMKDIPRRSHFTADFLIPYVKPEFGPNMAWGYTHTYLLLREGANPAALEAKFPDFLERYVHESTKARGFYYETFLQPLPEIYLGGNFRHQLAPVGDKNNIYMFSIVAFFILLIGCINFMNLSTARAMHRAKEVGIRKVVGANRNQLVKQFLGESTLISMIALLFALGLVQIIQRAFYHYAGKTLMLDAAEVIPIVLGIAGIALFVGLLAGSYPAFFLARFRAVTTLRGGATGKTKGQGLRKALVVFQFAISAFLIIASLTVFNQLSFMRDYRLGFDQERVVVLPSNLSSSLMPDYQAFKNELKQHAGVVDVTASSGLPGFRSSQYYFAEVGAAKEDVHIIKEYYTDYNFIDMLGLEIIAGRNFSQEITTDAGVLDENEREHRPVAVNEETVKRLGWESPEVALGKQIIADPININYIGTIIGVVKNFHYQSLREPIDALVMSVFLSRYSLIAIKVHPKDIQNTIAAIQETTERFDPGLPFDMSFLDREFAAYYEDEQKMSEIFGYFSTLAILIACLGLLGLASFTVERRTKEIGVRKVLGATVPGIVQLLSTEFTKPVLIANVIAWPVAYYVMSKWLQDFAYRIDIGLWVFLLAGGLVLSIALLTISSQAIKTALTNPVEALRYE